MNHYSHLEDYIKTLFHQLELTEPATLNMRAVAKKLDIKLFYWENASQAIFYDDMTAIFIDSRISPEVQWQDFTHELCHALIHTGDQLFMPPLFREYQEFKANNFMYHACIPTFMLDQIENLDYTTCSIHAVQQLFNVEYDFARRRLKNYLNKKLYVPY
ncbi:ImmA/IrrE family metallo-endopeptidase [Solibacillus sp. FSL H8-0523]|uniref:ImmA/IrrE family metallo-endopeptidase n=1 Tax=Solibacillus sp. FSL H8-0523 TaxID=2954511 RepID=UPI0031014B2F